MLILDESGSDSDVPIGERHMAFDLLNDKFKVPAVSTYCNCRLFQLPKLDQKHHLVKVFVFQVNFLLSENFASQTNKKKTKEFCNMITMSFTQHGFILAGLCSKIRSKPC